MTKLYKKKTEHVPEKIKKFVTGMESVTPDDIIGKFGVSRSTALFYLSRMENSGIIFRVQKGIYVTSAKLQLKPFVSRRIKRMNDHIKKRLPYVDFVIWSTENVSHFARHMITRHMTFIESPRENLQSITDVCMEKGWRVFDFSRASPEMIGLEENPVILVKRKDFYGSIVINNIRTATVEKVLVDLVFLATRKNYPISIGEIAEIISNILHSKEMNMALLRRYATRRNMMPEMSRIFSRLYEKHEFPQLIEYHEKEKSFRKMLNQIGA